MDEYAPKNSSGSGQGAATSEENIRRYSVLLFTNFTKFYTIPRLFLAIQFKSLKK